MSMVFCRGCGKGIHESATSCPNCGAPQATGGSRNKPWMAISSAVLAGICILGSLDTVNSAPLNKDETLGLIMFGSASLVLGGLTLHQKRPGKNIAIGALIVAMLSFLLVIGNSN